MCKIKYFLLSFFLSVFLIWKVYIYFFQSGQIITTSISSNGKYIITTDSKQYAILWDVLHQSKKILDRHANIYSAYFIKNTDLYMWQNEINRNVYIANLQNKIVKQLKPGFYIYSHVITKNLNYYLASDAQWNLILIKNQSRQLIKKDFHGFIGLGKPMQITLSNDEKTFLTCGFGSLYDDDPLSSAMKHPYGFDAISKISFLRGTILWSIEGKPIRRFSGNHAKTYGSISPDDQYILAADENMLGSVWSRASGNKIMDINYFDQKPFNRAPTVAIKFLDRQGHYLRFIQDVPFANLYTLLSNKFLKNISLDEYIRTNHIQFNTAFTVDTAPLAHILVMGNAFSTGLVIYHFDPKYLVLKRVWMSK